MPLMAKIAGRFFYSTPAGNNVGGIRVSATFAVKKPQKSKEVQISAQIREKSGKTAGKEREPGIHRVSPHLIRISYLVNRISYPGKRPNSDRFLRSSPPAAGFRSK